MISAPTRNEDWSGMRGWWPREMGRIFLTPGCTYPDY
jgi:hypothetical protein